MTDNSKPPSPTQVLIQSMEDFGKSEPKFVILLYVNEEGELIMRSSSDSVTSIIGTLECAKQLKLQKWMGENR